MGNFGQKLKLFWLKLPIINDSPQVKRWGIELGIPFLLAACNGVLNSFQYTPLSGFVQLKMIASWSLAII